MVRRNEAIADGREYSRVDSYLPMEVRELSVDECRQGFRSRISRQALPLGFSVQEEVGDKALGDWLKMLNAKLDFIIEALNARKEGHADLPFRQVNLSAGGMSFTSTQDYKPGAILEIKMIPYTLRAPLALCIYGEVVRCRKAGKEFSTAVKFILIGDDVRDELVRYVFERQREILRARRQ